MDLLLLVALVVTALVGYAWKVAVIKAGTETDGGGVKQAIPSVVFCSAFMVCGFLTLELFARDLAVWTGYAHKAFGG